MSGQHLIELVYFVVIPD